MIGLYIGGALGTAGYLWSINRPTDAGGAVAFVGFSALWPLMFAFAVYHLVRNAIVD